MIGTKEDRQHDDSDTNSQPAGDREKSPEADGKEKRKPKLSVSTVAKSHGVQIDYTVVTRKVADLHACDENKFVYRPFNPNTRENKRLIKSIETLGMLRPIGVTLDGVTIDGNRRLGEIKHLKREEVATYTVRVSQFLPDGQVDPRFYAILRAFNESRNKTADEQVREIAVEDHPDTPIQAVMKKRTRKPIDHPDSILIHGDRKLETVTEGKRPFLDAVQSILADYDARGFHELGARKIHYELAQHYSVPLHTDRPDVLYTLTKQCYHQLIELLTAARHQKLIWWDRISDDTRPYIEWATWNNVQEFCEEQFNEFLQGYTRNLLQSQRDFFVVLGEKSTLGPFIRPVAARYGIPMLLARGFCSGRPLYDLAQRFRKSGCSRLVPFIISDFDPSGREIPNSIAWSMSKLHGIRECHPIQVAITESQIDQLHLPSGGEVKNRCQGRERFLNLRNDDPRVWECEAMSVDQLQTALTNAVDSVLDFTAFNGELSRAKTDAKTIKSYREKVLAAIRSVSLQK